VRVNRKTPSQSQSKPQSDNGPHEMGSPKAGGHDPRVSIPLSISNVNMEQLKDTRGPCIIFYGKLLPFVAHKAGALLWEMSFIRIKRHLGKCFSKFLGSRLFSLFKNTSPLLTGNHLYKIVLSFCLLSFSLSKIFSNFRYIHQR